MTAKKNYTVQEFLNLRAITDEALASNKPLIYMDNDWKRSAESDWYVIYDTPNGKYITVSLWDTSGIRTTKVFKREYIGANLRLAPDPEPERKTYYVSIFDDTRSIGNWLHSSVERALVASAYRSRYVLPIDFVMGADGKWIVAPDQTTKVGTNGAESKKEKFEGGTKSDGYMWVTSLL